MEGVEDHDPVTGSGGGVRLRLFTSIAVPADVSRVLAGMAEQVAAASPGARPVAQDDQHLTFAFLGSVAEEYVPAVAVALEDAARSLPGPIACTVTGAAPFGGGRVLGATVEIDLLAVLAAVRERFLDAVRPYALERDERAWRPHVSLLRAPRRTTVDMPDPHELRRVIGTTWVAGRLDLLASLPGPGACLYRRLHAVRFGEPALRD